MAKLPLRFEPWSIYFAVLLNTRNMGTIPVDIPFVPRIWLPFARTLCICKPIPPDHLEMRAQSFRVSYIPSKLSSSIAKRKHELI